MKVLKPITVGAAQLFSSTVAEADYAAWSAATAYALEARVIRTTTHRIYERQVAGTSSAAPEDDAVNWLDVGPTNRWAMFDESPATATSAASSIVVELDLGKAITDLVLVGVVATQLLVHADGVLVRTVAVPAIVSPSTSSTVMVASLSIGAAARLKLTLTGSGTVMVSHVSAGTFTDIGETLPGAQVGIIDYSVKTTDDFGVVAVQRRAYSRKLQASVSVPIGAIGTVTAALEGLRAVVCFWQFVDGYESLGGLGFYRDWNIDVSDKARDVYTITVEALARDDVVVVPGQALTAVALDLNAALAKLSTAVDGAVAKIDPIVANAVRMDADISSLASTVTTLAVKAHSNDVLLRDAGISVDPASGKVTIAAIEQTQASLSQVQTTLDAQSATITSKASVSYVDQQIASAVLNGDTVVFDALDARLTTAETEIDGLQATVTLKADSTVVNSQGARLTTAETEIDGLQGVITTKADTTTVSGLDSRLTSAESTLAAQGDYASQVTELQALGRRLDQADADAANTTLAGLLATHQTAQNAQQSAANIAESLTAKINDDMAAEAAARLALSAVVGATQALVATEQVARADGDSANAASILTLQAQVTGQGGTLGILQASLTTEQTARADGDAANAASITALTATVTGQGTSIGTLQAGLTTEQTARANGDTANANSITTLSATVTAQGTSIGTLQAGLTTEQTARANGDTANANSITTLSATVTAQGTSIGTLQAGLTTEQTARASGDSANASSIAGVSARLNSGGDVATSIASVTTSAAANASAISGVQAQYGLKVAATRSDGKQVLAGIGLLSQANNATSQSEIILQADKLTFVPTSNPDAAVQPLLTTGTVNGQPALVLANVLIGDGQINVSKLSINDAKAMSAQANAWVFNSGTAASSFSDVDVPFGSFTSTGTVASAVLNGELALYLSTQAAVSMYIVVTVRAFNAATNESVTATALVWENTLVNGAPWSATSTYRYLIPIAWSWIYSGNYWVSTSARPPGMSGSPSSPQQVANFLSTGTWALSARISAAASLPSTGAATLAIRHAQCRLEGGCVAVPGSARFDAANPLI